jgi:hypothetical protein
MTYAAWGHLRLSPNSDTIYGSLRDDFGVVFHITGTRDGVGEYSIQGIPGPCPEGCKLPWEDDECTGTIG